MRTRKRHRGWAAAVAGAVVVGPATAQTPPPIPEVEQYYGTVRVNPPAPAPAPVPELAPPPRPVEPPKPPEPPVLLPVSARMLVVTAPAEPAGLPFAGLVNTLRESGEATAASAHATLKSVFGRLTIPAEPRTLPWVKASATVPEPMVAPAAPPAPTIVVVREPAAAVTAPPPAPAVTEYKPEPAPAAWWDVPPAMAAALGVSAAGFVMTALLWTRVGRPQQPVVVYATAPMPAVPPDPPRAAVTPNGMTLLGGFDAGPVPDTAERFEMGPTYQEQLRMQKEDEDRNRDAMAQHVLDANLELQAAEESPS